MDIPRPNHNVSLKILIVCGGLLLVVIISFIRSLTGPEYILSPLYLLPIVMVTWLIGLWPGVVLAIVSVASELIADLAMWKLFTSAAIPFVNEAFCLIVFLVIVYVVSSLKRNLDISHSDYLTGLANTRRFLEIADIELRRARRYERPIAIAFLDLDDFKAINDAQGHETGDEVIRSIAKSLANSVRDTDLVARYGGDEFLILMPEADEAAAHLIVERLQAQLAKTLVDREIQTTFSAGVVIFNKPPAETNEMLRQADTTMYSAKAAGKNAVQYRVVND